MYKIEVDGGFKKWVIYRRYRDFVLLNKKVCCFVYLGNYILPFISVFVYVYKILSRDTGHKSIRYIYIPGAYLPSLESGNW